MARYEPGTRVGALESANDELVRFFGWGVYVGDVVGGPVGDEFGIANPKIQLDDGGVVWGCECWWGPEERVRRMIGVRKVEIVQVPDRTAPGKTGSDSK